MLILLPPSEGKTPATGGEPVDPAGLWLPALASARRRVLTRLVALCARRSTRSVADSLRVLGLSDGQRDEVARNAGLASAPAASAASIYTGVLYEALNAVTLPATAREWLERSTVVFSGLWGVLRLTDRIPAPVGGLTAYWKKALAPALGPAAADGPVLDLRSGAYAAMWAPPGLHAATVRVLHERVVGGVPRRTVVSHFNKATKGLMVRALAEAGPAPASIDEVVAVLRDLGYTVEERPGATGRPRQLDVVVTEL